VGERAEHRVGVDLVGGAVVWAGSIAAQVVAVRGNGAVQVKDVWSGGARVQDGIADRNRRGATIAAVLGNSAAEGISGVAAEGAVSDRQRRAACKAVINDAAAAAGSGVAADGAVSDRQLRGATYAVIKDAATVL